MEKNIVQKLAAAKLNGNHSGRSNKCNCIILLIAV